MKGSAPFVPQGIRSPLELLDFPGKEEAVLGRAGGVCPPVQGLRAGTAGPGRSHPKISPRMCTPSQQPLEGGSQTGVPGAEGAAGAWET